MAVSLAMQSKLFPTTPNGLSLIVNGAITGNASGGTVTGSVTLDGILRDTDFLVFNGASALGDDFTNPNWSILINEYSTIHAALAWRVIATGTVANSGIPTYTGGGLYLPPNPLLIGQAYKGQRALYMQFQANTDAKLYSLTAFFTVYRK